MAGVGPGNAPVVFITGTDTGVGKTLLTGLLLSWLRTAGVNALAIKPFASGGTNDARILGRLQSGRLGLSEISPYRFRLPLAPAVAAELEGRHVHLKETVRHVERIRRRCDCLLVEGCGGVLSPLGASFTLLELIQHCGSHVIVVSQNRLGAINQVLLTVRALESERIKSMAVALMNSGHSGKRLTETNARAMAQRIKSVVLTLPDLGENACKISCFQAHAKFLQKTLARLLPSDTVCALLEAAVVEAMVKK
ncbi:MAG: dethiobiotin synthase [Verrucomicrobia bacterium]|nr:dethiobiotin synthase [Verrucomicrobiota bacterium]